MNIRLKIIGIALFSCTTLTAYAKQPPTKLVDSITGEEIAKHIEILASDKFEGRLPGTVGEQLTIDYISKQFKQVGLEPVADGDYLEPVTLVGTRVSDISDLQFKEQELEFGSEFIVGGRNHTGNLSIDKADAVFVGYAFDTPERDDFKDTDLQDKVVFFLWGDPPQDAGTEAKLNPRTASGMRQTKYLKAMEEGALAAFAIHNQKAAGYPWEVLGKTEPQWVYRLQGVIQEPEIAGMISTETAAKLFAETTEEYQQLVDSALSVDFQPLQIKDAVSLSFTQESKSVESNNVVGLLRSETPSSEYVLYCAHWDHMGKSGNGEDKIMNGAVDNATGTAAIMVIARAMAAAKKKLKRNVIFFATTAEEQGLLGAYAYANNPVYPLESTVGVINIDSIFPFGKGSGMTVTGYGNSELDEFLRESAELEGRQLQPEMQPEYGAFFRSDHFPFVVKGVPSLFAVGGPSAAEFEASPELQQKYADFGQNKYHKAADEYDAEEWDMGGIVQDVRIHFRTGYSLATDDRIPNWYLNSEFRALRDRQRADK